MSTIPNHLPTLSKGAHAPGDGEACVMEYVSLLAGEEWSDHPTCTHPVLASMARTVNDRLSDDERHVLVPLIGRLFGTSGVHLTEHERQVLSVRLACWIARQVTEEGTPGWAAIEAAEGWGDETVSAAEVRAAEDAALGTAATFATFAATARTATAAAVSAASAAASAATNAADADLPGLLTGLIDEYDRLTGHTEHTRLDDAALADLSARVTAMGGAR